MEGDLREDVWDLCLNDAVSDDYTDGPRAMTSDEAITNRFW